MSQSPVLLHHLLGAARALLLALPLAAGAMALATPASAGDVSLLRVGGNEYGRTQQVSIGLNKSLLVDLPTPAAEVIVSQPTIASAIMRTKTRAIVQGVGAGSTNMMFLDGSGNRAYASADQGTVIGRRPEGCPHAYCGCGLRKYLGLADVRLNLASNWARLFPREPTPHAGLAAVRSGHVMYIEAAAGNGEWLIRDYNSGGGLSRLHVRDLRGYVFVNPRG